jgi:hypothetical protein
VLETINSKKAARIPLQQKVSMGNLKVKFLCCLKTIITQNGRRCYPLRTFHYSLIYEGESAYRSQMEVKEL